MGFGQGKRDFSKHYLKGDTFCKEGDSGTIGNRACPHIMVKLAVQNRALPTDDANLGTGQEEQQVALDLLVDQSSHGAVAYFPVPRKKSPKIDDIVLISYQQDCLSFYDQTLAECLPSCSLAAASETPKVCKSR